MLPIGSTGCGVARSVTGVAPIVAGADRHGILWSNVILIPRNRFSPFLKAEVIMPIPIDQFKHVMRQWISGVTIVTMQAAEHRHGLTVSGFLGVSLEPPLVLISIGQELTSAEILKDNAAYAVNFLREDQNDLSDR